MDRYQILLPQKEVIYNPGNIPYRLLIQILQPQKTKQPTLDQAFSLLLYVKLD